MSLRYKGLVSFFHHLSWVNDGFAVVCRYQRYRVLSRLFRLQLDNNPRCCSKLARSTLNLALVLSFATRCIKALGPLVTPLAICFVALFGFWGALKGSLNGSVKGSS